MPSVTSEFLFVVWFVYLQVGIYRLILGCDPVFTEQSHDNKEGSQGRGLKGFPLLCHMTINPIGS